MGIQTSQKDTVLETLVLLILHATSEAIICYQYNQALYKIALHNTII